MRIVFKNLFSLGFVQGISLLAPLILTPYLTGKIGVDMFGIVTTAQSVAIIFTLLTDFGFNTTAVRHIAQAAGDHSKVQRIINVVFFLKLLLLAAAFVLFLAVVLVVPHFHQFSPVYLWSFSLVVGQTFLPIWYYQGIEKIDRSVIPVVSLKLLTIVFVFLCVKEPGDARYVNLLYGTSSLLAGIILYWKITRRYKISTKYINLSGLKSEFKSSSAMFLSNVGVVIYSNSTVLILSFFVTPALLGVYSVVEKIIQLIKTSLIMVHQVIYPRLCNLIRINEADSIPFLRSVYSVVWPGVFAVCIVLFAMPGFVVGYFIKDPAAMKEASSLLRSLSFLCFIISLNMPFYQSLLAYHKDWLTVRVLIACSVISILLNLVLVPALNITGTIISMYIIEMTVTSLLVYLFFQFKKKNRYAARTLFK